MKVGILGAGGIAKHMAKTINQMDDVTAVAIASRNLDKAKNFAKELNIKKAYGSYEELVCDEDIDLIYIATPHSHHYEHAMLCLNNNKPVLCEKAFMANFWQAKEIIKLAKKKNVFITEAIWTRYLPSRKMLAEILNSNIIGEVNSVSASLSYKIDEVDRIKLPELAGGALLDIGVYPLNFALMVLGNEIEEIKGDCYKNEYGVDLKNNIHIKYKNGKTANITSNTMAIGDNQGVIYGSKGYILVDNCNHIRKIYVYDSKRKLIKTHDVPEEISGFEYEVRACKNALLSKKIECDEMPHKESLLVMKLMDKLRKDWGVVYPFDN